MNNNISISDYDEMILYANSKFILEKFPEEYNLGYSIYDLIAKYGGLVVLEHWKKWKEQMYKELRNKISENKILTHNERAKVISDLESYEELRSKINKAVEEIKDIPVLFFEFPLGKAQVIRKDVVLEILKRNLGE